MNTGQSVERCILTARLTPSPDSALTDVFIRAKIGKKHFARIEITDLENIGIEENEAEDLIMGKHKSIFLDAIELAISEGRPSEDEEQEVFRLTSADIIKVRRET